MKDLSECRVLIVDDVKANVDVLVQALRAEAPAGRRPVVLAITASDFDLNEREARERGFDGYMLKPLDLAVLEAKLSILMKSAGPASPETKPTE